MHDNKQVAVASFEKNLSSITLSWICVPLGGFFEKAFAGTGEGRGRGNVSSSIRIISPAPAFRSVFLGMK